MLQIGYSKDMDTEDAEMLDIIQRIHHEIKKREQRDNERAEKSMRSGMRR